MQKKGLTVLVIVAIVLGGLAVTVLGAGVYLYNFHTFKTVRLCLGDPEETDFACSMVQDCLDQAEELQTQYNISELPKFARDKLDMIAEEAVYCDGTCKVKNIRGINLETYELEELESCNEGEKEILMDIKGKEGIQIWKLVKDMEDQ
jgi:hypothetical protein